MTRNRFATEYTDATEWHGTALPPNTPMRPNDTERHFSAMLILITITMHGERLLN
jgi:hypothetical protein